MSNTQSVIQYSACLKTQKKKKFVCEYCKKEFQLNRGEMLYQYYNKCFCSYNCRSKYKAQKRTALEVK